MFLSRESFKLDHLSLYDVAIYVCEWRERSAAHKLKI